MWRGRSFYPRHPRGWRHVASRLRELDVRVSIHATLAGGDPGAAYISGHSAVSIHATLAGGDLGCLRAVKYRKWFLSTPPSRAATIQMSGTGCRTWVSIHATLAGGDCGLDLPVGRYNVFLSTPPSRVATAFLYVGVICREFLSTPPSRVATAKLLTTTNGCDSFYPRHPRGWRRVYMGRGADSEPGFYPRHPRGWRRGRTSARRLTQWFLSTPPSRVATRCHDVLFRFLGVSIHATLAGGDAASSL